MSALVEVRAMLLGAVEELDRARAQAGVARAHLADAVGVLDGLGEVHAEPLVPPQLLRAAAELDRGLALIGAGRHCVTDIAGRL